MINQSVWNSIERYINKHDGVIRDLVEFKPDYTNELRKGGEVAVDPGLFLASRDTWMYSEMLKKAVSLVPDKSKTSFLIDLGAGNSIPSIVTMLDADHNVKVEAVEINHNAIDSSKNNAKSFGVIDRFSFHQGNMLQYLNQYNYNHDNCYIIASNPPYVPTNIDINENQEYSAINGGEDGLYYLKSILSSNLPKCSIVAVQWSSLSTPRKMINLIEENFKCLNVIAARVPFGIYTSKEKILSFLNVKKNADEVFFESDEDTNYYYIISTILQRID